MKLLVTGGAGYVGSVCAAQLVQSGHEVTVLDDLSTGHRDAVPDQCRFVPGEVGATAAGVLAGGFDAVVHLAARSLVGESTQRPADYWHGNVITTLRLLDAMRATGTPRLVFSSTAAVYGEPAETPIPEVAPTRPTNTYGATKLAIDHAIANYAAAYGIAGVSLRYFNAAGARGRFGERHTRETHLVPIVLQAATGERQSVQVFGDDWPTRDGTCVRDYVHVQDLAVAHELALERATPGRHAVYNLGLGAGYSVREVIETCREVTGRPVPAVTAPRRSGDPAVLVASNSRAAAELGWRPRHVKLATIVEDAWRFTLEHRTHQPAR